MDEHDRTIGVYLGALLMDGIIPPDLEVIEHTIHSLKRAASLRRKWKTSRDAEIAAAIRASEMEAKAEQERAQPKDSIRVVRAFEESDLTKASPIDKAADTARKTDIDKNPNNAS